MRKLSTDEKSVKAFFASYNLQADQYEDSQMQEGRTPDFKVTFPEDDFFFFSEVKSLKTKVDSTGLLHTRVFNIFTSCIHDAYGQFKAVNSLHMVPNVLVFVTHNFQINWHSFQEFLQGFIAVPAGDGHESVIPIRRVSTSIYKNDVKEIDLFVFLQSDKPNFFFTNKQAHLTNRLLHAFKIDRQKMSTVRVG